MPNRSPRASGPKAARRTDPRASGPGVVLIRTPVARARRVAVALLVLLLIHCSPEGSRPADGAPKRIVSLVPTATETLFALGAGDLLVGRSKFCDEPPAARSLPAVGDAAAANVERIVRLDPDLVLVASGPQEEALAALKGPIRVETVLADTIAGVRETTTRLARLTGREEAGRRLLAEIDAALAVARARHAAGSGPRVLFAAQHEPLLVAGAGSYVGELLAAIGARNVAGDMDRPWPTLSLESLVARDPQVILDAALDPEGDPGAAGEEFWGQFGPLSAVRDGRVRRVTAEAVVRPGPRLPRALRILEDLVYGEGR